MSEASEEKREFERHALDLAVKVFDGETGREIEHTHLQNISGGGACFLSGEAEAYTPGREVVLEMHLPVMDDQEALMQGRATVIWIGEADREDDPLAAKRIGVSMIRLVSAGLQEGSPLV